jgi:HPt (histidine-containing phosphotransfer) domain-containing protein
MAQLAAKDGRVKIGRVEIDMAADAPPLAPREPATSELAISKQPAIDRAHLARMTHGERDLECEVLQLYATQANLLLGRMGQASAAAVGALAHTLKGSSRGVGAWQVAEAAAAVEVDAAQGRDTAAAIARLSSAIRAAQVHIVALIRADA